MEKTIGINNLTIWGFKMCPKGNWVQLPTFFDSKMSLSNLRVAWHSTHTPLRTK